ncbi:unannotated protein [freshwater metagenome]|uniref:Unannotated protein n=1 Tax=freshwater metagenome TaxID=449393 RepID=A0A6J6UIT6_9ZZZZ|nr:hypothetical protein [Actinomycetota bacterium]MTA63702.1 hypothetical protein [Actinomycetota bacterium]
MTPRPSESSTQHLAVPAEVTPLHEAGIEVIADGGIEWHLDASFLQSNWTCIWGRGCKGILDHPAEDLGQGCCSVGAELVDDEAATTAMLAGYLDAESFQFYEAARSGGVFSDDTKSNTRVIDGACIFLNRPDFPGGAGCALHLAAEVAEESALDWKPSVCWQLPVRVQWEMQETGVEIAHLRAWQRGDWGDDGDSMAWCCTEEPEAYVGDRQVIESLAEELEEILGTTVFVEIQRRMNSVEVHGEPL